ncbi:hypothetical protein V5O48_007443 [Marasmius crinis-equi]|uniref:F-box domain-containing protein n=1 Tax=Marasmius crinis-equi TaxID=585013 RepID=A0ABR3FGN2_9AGAR
MTLPGELTDIVIDFCHEDEPSLLACSLVCKPWGSRSRYHLLRTNRLIHAQNASTFQDLLISPHCTFLPHLFALDVVVAPLPATGDETKWLDDLWKTLNSLPDLSLQKLHLGDVSVDLLPKLRLSTHAAASLKSLHLECCDGRGKTTSSNITLRVCDYLNTFEALQELSFEYSSAGRRISFIPPSPRDLEGIPRLRLPHLRRMTLSSAYRVFLPLFSQPGFIECPSLTHFDLQLPISVDEGTLQKFLDVVCAPRVEVLKVSFRYMFRHVEGFFPAINLANFRSLRSVVFELGEVTHSHEPSARNADIRAGVPFILQQMRGVDPKKTQITFVTQFSFAPLTGLSVDVQWVEVERTTTGDGKTGDAGEGVSGTSRYQ